MLRRICSLLIFLALFWPRAGFAAISEVGGGTQRATGGGGAGYNNVDSATLAFPGNVTSGNLMVVVGSAWNTGGGPTITVTDSRSTSYTVRTIVFSQYTIFVAWGVTSSSGANTVTVDPGGTGNYLSFSVDEFTGQHATPLDVNDGTSSTASSTSASDSITTASANALVVGAMGFTNAHTSTIVAGASTTLIGAHTNQTTDTAHGAAFNIISGAAGSYATNWTLGTSSTWTAITVSFAEATGGGGVAAKNMMLVGVGP